MEFIKIYIFEIFVTSAIGFLFSNAKIQSKRYMATQSGIKSILRDRIISAVDKVKDQGFMHLYQHENISKLYEDYVALGGNGTIVHLMKEISNLEIKTSLK